MGCSIFIQRSDINRWEQANPIEPNQIDSTPIPIISLALMQRPMLNVVRTLANLVANLKFRGKDRLLSLFCPKVSEAVVILFGYRVRLDLTDHIQRKMF